MAAREVAHGEVNIEVNDREASASLRRIESQFDRTMDKIDREEAEASLGANLSHLKADLKKAEAELDKFRKRQANKDLTAGQQKYARQRVKDLEAETKQLSKAEAAEKKRLEQMRAQNRELDFTAKRTDAIARREEARERTMAAAEKRRVAALRQQKTEADKLARQQERDAVKMERLKTREAAAQERSNRAAERQPEQIAKAQVEYTKLIDKVEKLASAKRKAERAGDERGAQRLGFEESEALAKMARIHSELERVGSPVDIKLNIEPGRNLGEKVRADAIAGLMTGGSGKMLFNAGKSLGQSAGEGIGNGIKEKLKQGKGIKGAIGNEMLSVGTRFAASIGNGLSKLSDLTVRVGPFTATIRQATLAASLLGPVLIDLIGSVGSLGSVLGSATLGLGALGAGFLGGAIPAAIGFGSVIMSVGKQFKASQTAANAYQAQVLKSGKNSAKAKKKLEEYHNTLKGVDARTKENILSAHKLNGKWTALTAPARASAFKVIGDGISYARQNMDWFAKATNSGMAVAQKSISRWISGLNSAEGKGILSTMFGNFNATLGPLLDGLGNIATYLGRVGRIASGYLPGMAAQFRAWSQGVADGGKNAGTLAKKVDTAINSLKTVGRFAMAGGRLLKAFFSGGVSAGNSFVQTMTNAMNRWTAFLNTAEGQNKLHDFFSRSVSGAQSLWSALAPLVTIFVKWAMQMSPFAAAFFKGVGVVGQFVSALLSMTALRAPVMALVTTLGFLWATHRISTAVSAISGFVRSVLGIKAATTGLAATNATASASTNVLAASETRAAEAATVEAAAQTRLAVANRALTVSSTATGASMAAMGAASATSAGRVARGGEEAAVGASKMAKLGAGVDGALVALTGLSASTLGIGAIIAAPAVAALKLGHDMGTAKEAAKNLDDQLGGNIINLRRTGEAMSQGEAEAFGFMRIFDDGNRELREASVSQNHFQQAIRASSAATSQASSLGIQYAQAQMGVKQAQQQASQALRQYGRHSNEYKSAVLQVRAAEDQARTSRDQLTASQRTASNQAARGVQFARNVIANLRQQGASTSQLAGATRQLVAAQNHQAATNINNQRSLQGLTAYTGRAAQQVGQFARQFKNVPNAKKLVVNADTARAGANLAKTANQAKSLGRGSTVVKILANSKNAEQATARLKRMLGQLANGKYVAKLRASSSFANSEIRRLQGRINAIRQGRVPGLKANSGPARAEIRRLQGIINGIRQQRAVAIRAETAQARQGIAGVRAEIRAIDGKIARTSIITEHKNIYTKGKPFGRASGGTLNRADGGTMNAATGRTPDEKRLQLAELRASTRPVKDMSTGGKVTRPTTVTGEENRPEFVISTNPAYRERNIAILSKANEMVLGRGARGGRGGDRPAFAAGGTAGYYTDLNATVFDPSPRVADFKPKKKTKKAVNKVRKTGGRANRVPGNPWAGGLTKLLTQQEDLEREASIRESGIREPEDFIIEGKDKAGNATFTFDQNAWNQYKADIQSVQAVYVTLVRVVQQIREAAQKSAQATREQLEAHRANINAFNTAIGIEKRRAKSKNSGVRKQANKRLGKLRPAKDKEITAKNDKDEYLKTLPGIDKEAGFDFREYQQKITDMNTAMGRREASEKANIASQSGQGGAGGSGGTDASLTPAAQTFELSKQRQELYQNYGSNAKANSGSTVGKTASRVGSALTSSIAAPTAGARVVQSGAAAASTSATTAARAASGGVTGTISTQTGTVPAGAGVSQVAGALGITDQQAAAVAAGGKVNIVNNTFPTPPPDPHTWSQGVSFELEAM